MKKQLITLLFGVLSFSLSAQKKELKSIKKDVKAKEFSSAMTKVDALEKTISTAKDKYRSNFYFLKAKTLKGLNKYSEANKTVQVLLNFEQKNKSSKYTSDASLMLQDMAQSASKEALELYNVKKDYKAASEKFYLTYELSPKDTTFVFNAAVSAEQAKDYDNALLYYKKLQEINYSGIEVIYYVTDKSGKLVNGGTKSNRDLLLKSPEYSTPKDAVSPSKKGEIAKRIALILKGQGKTDEAIKAITDARKANPKDENLIFAAIEIYHKLKDMDKYRSLMKEAVKLRPNDPNLFYNLGVVNANEGETEQAITYYKKAISLISKNNNADPKLSAKEIAEIAKLNYNTNLNLAAVILAKDSAIIENINKAIDKNKTKDYDKYVKEQKELYKTVLPYLKKADELKRSLQTVKTLKNIYESLEMKAEAKKYVKLYKEMK